MDTYAGLRAHDTRDCGGFHGVRVLGAQANLAHDSPGARTIVTTSWDSSASERYGHGKGMKALAFADAKLAPTSARAILVSNRVARGVLFSATSRCAGIVEASGTGFDPIDSAFERQRHRKAWRSAPAVCLCGQSEVTGAFEVGPSECSRSFARSCGPRGRKWGAVAQGP